MVNKKENTTMIIPKRLRNDFTKRARLPGQGGKNE